jgi:hypothetical protein
MAVKWSNAVDSCEEHGTRVELWDKNQFTADVVLRCDWYSRWTLLRDIWENRLEYLSGGTGGPPTKCYLTSATTSPAPGAADEPPDGEAEKPVKALIRLRYSTKTGDVFNESLEPDVEAQRLPHTQFTWDKGNANAPVHSEQAPVIQRRRWLYSRTTFGSQILPPDFYNLVGTVNSAQWQAKDPNGNGGIVTAVDGNGTATAWKIFAPETMLYLPGTSTRAVSIIQGGTQKGWTYTTRWRINEQTWNKFYNSYRQANNESEYWQYMYRKADGANAQPFKPYPLSDHSTLLAYPPIPELKKIPK